MCFVLSETQGYLLLFAYPLVDLLHADLQPLHPPGEGLITLRGQDRTRTALQNFLRLLLRLLFL